MAQNKIFIPYFISNEQFAPARVLPRLFFYNGTKQCDIIKVQYYNTGSTLVTIDTFTAFPYFDHYSGETTTTSSLSLLFLNEDPVYGTQPPSQSLYDKYWSKYVDLLYDPKTRILRCNAVLPFAVYNKLELNDVIQLRSNYYHLRAVNDYNLRTGECRMELLGPLLEGSLDNIEFFDNRCEEAPQISNVTNNTGSRIITFNITGSNCCNNPNDLAVQFLWGTGSCPASSSNTNFVTIPNQPTASVAYGFLPSGVNCVTMSVANYCYGFATGSFSFVFSGSLSGSFLNTAISASTQKDNCPVCQTGSFYTTIVPQGTFSSSVSQANANASASAYLTSVSQSNANTFGSCSINTFYNIQISASVTRNDCPTCQTGSTLLYTVAASSSLFTNTCSLSEANTSASIYFAATSQSYANASGSCITNSFYSTQISASVQKNDCDAPCFTGSFSLVTLPASYSFNSCSQATAQTTAQAYFNSISQSQANASGSCGTSSVCGQISIGLLYDNYDPSIYPVTLSYFTAVTTSVMPSESSSGWSIFGYITASQSQSNSPYTTANVLLANSSSPSYNLWKARGPNNIKLTANLPNPVTNQFTLWGGTRIWDNFYSDFGRNGANTTSSITLNSGHKLSNDYTQSVGDATNWKIQVSNFGAIGPNYGPLTSSVSGNLNVYYIYTASLTYPSASDSKWTNIGKLPQAISQVMSPYITENNIVITGSSFTPVFISSSLNQIYYWKFTDASGSFISSSIGSGTFTSGSYTGSTSNGISRTILNISSNESDGRGYQYNFLPLSFYSGSI